MQSLPKRQARWVSLDELHEDPANVRKHGDRNRAAVRASLSEFGQVEPLVVQAGTGRVLGGNCRLAELRALGQTEALVLEVAVEGSDATRLALALNRSAELAEWSADLGQLLAEVDNLGDLWTDAELKALLAPAPTGDEWGAAMGGLPDEDRAPFQQMTFTVADVQAEVIRRALNRAIKDGAGSTTNDNSNGNALAALAAAYLRENAP